MRWMRLTTGLLVALLAIPPAVADEEWDKLDKEFEAAQQKWYEAYEAAAAENKKAGKQGAVDFSKLPPRPETEFTPKFKAYAESRAGKPEALPALLALVDVRSVPDASGETPARWALQQLAKNHCGEKDLEAALRSLGFADSMLDRAEVRAFYEKVAAENREPKNIAAARFNLAMLAYRQYQRPAPTEAGKTAAKPDDAARKDVLKQFEQIAGDFAETSAGKRAAGFVTELSKLQIGMTAPEIEGPDADGNTIRLSQFRGQVVVLDFWGFW